MLTSLFSLFYVIGGFHRFLHGGRASLFAAISTLVLRVSDDTVAMVTCCITNMTKHVLTCLKTIIEHSFPKILSGRNDPSKL